VIPAAFWIAYLVLSFICVRAIVTRLRTSGNLLVISVAPMSTAVVNFIHTNLFSLFPARRVDLYVNAVDGWIGYPANRTALFLQSHQLIRALAYADYFGVVLVVFGAVVAVSRLRGYEELIDAMPAILLCGTLLMPIYWLFPVSGPLYAFSNFPTVYSGPVHSIYLEAIPNGLPSGHFALALIVLYLLRHWKWGIVAGFVHVLLTGLATMGLGEHYALDLILAVPYTYAVILLSRWSWFSVMDEAKSSSLQPYQFQTDNSSTLNQLVPTHSQPRNSGPLKP
jgi:hypothetical protein